MDIVATGMASPAGFSAVQGCAALRAGIARFAELPYHDLHGEPIIGAPVPDLAEDFEHDERLIALLYLALKDVLREKLPFPAERVPLLVAIAEPGRPGPAAPAGTLVARVQQRVQTRFHPEHSQVISRGHAAGFEALREARTLLLNGAAPACLVAGVDSYLNGPALAWLERHDRLKTPGNSNGVIPGEAAAAVLVRPDAKGRAVRVRGLGFALEKVHVLSEEPFLAAGLTEATRQALADAGLAMHDLPFRISDVTGESYGFKELAVMTSRLLRRRLEELPVWHCADAIGDAGAAAGICQLVIAFWAFRKGYAPGDRVLCLTSSTPGERAAAILEHAHG